MEKTQIGSKGTLNFRSTLIHCLNSEFDIIKFLFEDNLLPFLYLISWLLMNSGNIEA
jgi:hypothetical protein